MAGSSLKVCLHPGCRRFVRDAARCPEHNRRAPDTRPNATARGYDRKWRAFRASILAQHPLCVDCLAVGRTAAAHHLHHIEKLADAPERRLDPENVMPLCERCHNRRTARGE